MKLTSTFAYSDEHRITRYEIKNEQNLLIAEIYNKNYVQLFKAAPDLLSACVRLASALESALTIVYNECPDIYRGNATKDLLNGYEAIKKATE